MPRFTKIIIAILVIAALALGATSYALVKHFTREEPEASEANEQEGEKSKQQKEEKPAYTLVAYEGQVFGAKIPKGWEVTDNESGIDIMDPQDNNTGSSGAIAVGWFGEATPDSFIAFMLETIGAKDVRYTNVSKQEIIKDPTSNLAWVMRTKTFTFTKSGKKLKAKASAGVLNGYGQFMGLITAFQTTEDKWGKWAPTLERIAQTITIINPSKAGGIDKVRLPTAADLANDSSPLMESWEYRNEVTDRTSHEFSDAIMGQESDLYSPSSGQSYTLPLNDYDPTAGGYRNPDKPTEILVDPYER